MVIYNIQRGRDGESVSENAIERTDTSFMMTLTVATTTSVVVLGGLRWYYHSRRKRQEQLEEESREHNSNIEQAEIRQLQQQRKEERTGRIRAEVRLRTTLKQLQQLQLQLFQYQKANQHLQTNGELSTDDEHLIQKDSVASSEIVSHHVNARTETDNTNNSYSSASSAPSRTMLLNSIGTVVTPYTKRMGTPRQGALVPASRGYIQLHHHIPADVATGLELYSHIWVLFEFHANTDLNGTAVDMINHTDGSCSNNTKTNIVSNKTKKSKIRPPRGNGIKVGQLATRSPHRPNPIGLSLVSVDRWDVTHKRLYISGIDIVHGTPVYDIKPVVPWDVPGYYLNQNVNGGGSASVSDTRDNSPVLRVPDWVSSTEDVIDTVTFSITAQEQLQQCIHQGHLAPLYTNDNDGSIGATTTIQQILAQDPRSSHKGLKSNARGSKTPMPLPSKTIKCDTDDVPVDNESRHSTGSPRILSVATSPACYSLVFCNVKVSFTVTETDGCCVMEVIPIEFDANQYVDGVPIVTEGLTLE